MNGKSDGHQLLPYAINTVNRLKPHLCNLALHRGKVYPEQFQQCNSPCKYGIKLLDLMNLELLCQPEEITVSKLSRQGQARPTLHQRLRGIGK